MPSSPYNLKLSEPTNSSIAGGSELTTDLSYVHVQKPQPPAVYVMPFSESIDHLVTTPSFAPELKLSV